MTSQCRRGNWIYHPGDGKRFVAFSDYLGIGLPGQAAPFWAEREDSEVCVFRASLSAEDRLLCIYFGGTFEISYSVAGVADLNQISSNELKNYYGSPEALARIPWVGAKKYRSWIESMSREQYNRFLADIVDPDLYSCLFDCLPPSNDPEQYSGYGKERPSRVITKLEIPKGNWAFDFIEDWFAGKIELSRESVFAKVASLMHYSIMPRKTPSTN